jgi:hypothetical protein
MKFSELEKKTQKDLIRALDKRFPVDSDRKYLLNVANIPWPKSAKNSWKNILYCIGDRPRLMSRLLSTAIQLRPTDKTLLAIGELMFPSQKFRLLTMHGVSMLLGTVCAIILFWEAEYTQMLTPKSIEKQTVSVAEQQYSSPQMVTDKAKKSESEIPPIINNKNSTETQVKKQEPSVPIQEPATPIQEPVTPIQEPVTPIQEPVTPTQQTVTQSTQTNTPPQRQQANSNNNAVGNCQISGDGELIGYWYVGDQPINTQDGWLEMNKWRNVRADYPDKHNSYNSRSTINCVLSPNTKVFLKEPPILVPGNEYWVALYGNRQGT